MINRTKKIWIGISCFFLLLWGCEEFIRRMVGGFAGSYPFVEYWDLKVAEKDLLEIIKEIRIENPNLQPPDDLNWLSTKDSYWQHINFYYEDSKEIVHTWTRPSIDSTMTRVALVGFSPIDNKKNIKLINRDYWYVANKIRINKFERRIIYKIKEKLKKKAKI